MILRGARVATGPETAALLDVGIEHGRLRIPAGATGGPEIDGRGLLIMPGLINAHDHLELNLFPRLGAGPYRNASEWARDIYRPHEEPVRTQLEVPKKVRLVWGALKNLACGVTTVMHHNPYEGPFDEDFPVRVVKEFGWAHSLAFSPDVAERYRATAAAHPFCIHAAEGTDACAAEEVRRLDALGALGPNTVIVHGAGIDARGLDLIARRGASVVWCPTSNRFTLGRSLPQAVLDSGVRIALGTDSALTARGDMADELVEAAERVSWTRLYGMVTTEAARILRLARGEGEIRDGGVADLLLLRERGETPARSLADLHPELVVVGGKVRLASASPRWKALLPEGQPLEIEGRGTFVVDCDLAALWQPTVAALGAEPCLARRRVRA